MAGKQMSCKKQKSREAAKDRLMKEITLARKAADEFLKTTGAAERKAALLAARCPAAMPCFENTYDTYQCICNRIKMLQSLLESMEYSTKRLGSECSYLN